MYCPYCGKPIDDDAVFCEHCGRQVPNREPLDTTGEPAVPAAPAAPVPAPLTNSGSEERITHGVPEGAHESLSLQESAAARQRHIKWAILALVLVLVGGLAFGGYRFWQSRQPENWSEEKFKEEALQIKYEDFSDNPAAFADKPVTFTGAVNEVTVAGEEVLILLDTLYDEQAQLYYGGTVLLKVPGDRGQEITQWDEVTCYGMATGETEHYEGRFGEYNPPVIRVKYLDMV